MRCTTVPRSSWKSDDFLRKPSGRSTVCSAVRIGRFSSAGVMASQPIRKPSSANLRSWPTVHVRGIACKQSIAAGAIATCDRFRGVGRKGTVGHDLSFTSVRFRVVWIQIAGQGLNRVSIARSWQTSHAIVRAVADRTSGACGYPLSSGATPKGRHGKVDRRGHLGAEAPHAVAP